jgi:hypothetical protein
MTVRSGNVTSTRSPSFGSTDLTQTPQLPSKWCKMWICISTLHQPSSCGRRPHAPLLRHDKRPDPAEPALICKHEELSEEVILVRRRKEVLGGQLSPLDVALEMDS